MWEGQPAFLNKGLDLSNESPLKWFSEPPESMVGTMNRFGREPSPFQGGEEVRYQKLGLILM
ncbi:hypothetical protein D1867_10855 [Acidianus infernus]|uniref:Uncharacterized protein n=1 Tax=Acidianus infernus TaxID=12915 RepID=A0A6A9QK84_ACIIN|nr:hypothetical protein [Acidianus infernus]MUM65730.1 hypothetical protein [Acidianus infernus]